MEGGCASLPRSPRRCCPSPVREQGRCSLRISLSVAAPRPRLARFSLKPALSPGATPPLTRAGLLGVSVKTSHSSFFHGGCFCSQLRATAGRAAGWGEGLAHWAPMAQLPLTTHPSFATPWNQSLRCYFGTSKILSTYMKCQTKFAPKKERDCSFPTFP